MPINVLCPTCKSRFQVSEKFAGKQGPCPKCKAVITVPKVEEAVVIHAPEEFSGGATTVAKDAKGRSVLKPIARTKTTLNPIKAAIWFAIVLVAVLLALIFRVKAPDTPNAWVLTVGAYVLGLLTTYPAYQVFRDQELEGFSGLQLIWRVAVVAFVFGAMWGAFHAVKSRVFDESNPMQIYHLAVILPGPIIISSLVCMALLELEPIPSFFVFAFYIIVTIVFRALIGMDALPIPPPDASGLRAFGHALSLPNGLY